MRGARKITGISIPILPTVYDDSLSYMEIINKLIKAVNELSKIVEDYTDEKLIEFIEEHAEEILNRIGLGITYDAETETLVIVWEVGNDE